MVVFSLGRSFRSKDTAGAGRLAGVDLACAFAAATGRKPADAEIEALTGVAGSEWVDETAFVRHLGERARRHGQRERLRECFRSIDGRRKGCLTRDDARREFSQVAPTVPPEVVDEVFDEADQDGDGRVGWRDFESLISSFDAKDPVPARPASSSQYASL